MKIKCDTCPYAKDKYPGKVDHAGNHFHICGMSGNMIYLEPRREKKYSGSGYIYFGITGCGLFESVDEALASMTEIERERWMKKHAQT